MEREFGLYLVLTDPRVGYERCTEAAVAEGVRFVQLRIKGVNATEALPLAARLRAITRQTATQLIINDDVELAKAVDAKGVHLGQSDMTIEQARHCWNSTGKLFGLSTHNAAQASGAQAQGVDYIGVGPIFPTPTKPQGAPALGPEVGGAIAISSATTAVAIGGIDRRNLKRVIDAGFVNFAVVRAVCHSPDPRDAIRALTDIWRAR